MSINKYSQYSEKALGIQLPNMFSMGRRSIILATIFVVFIFALVNLSSLFPAESETLKNTIVSVGKEAQDTLTGSTSEKAPEETSDAKPEKGSETAKADPYAHDGKKSPLNQQVLTYFDQAFSLHKPEPYDFPALKEQCNSNAWPEDAVYLDCKGMAAGLTTIMSQVKVCLKMAVETQSGIILPSMPVRDSTDLKNFNFLNGDAYQTYDYWFDAEHLTENVKRVCPQMKIIHPSDLAAAPKVKRQIPGFPAGGAVVPATGGGMSAAEGKRPAFPAEPALPVAQAAPAAPALPPAAAPVVGAGEGKSKVGEKPADPAPAAVGVSAPVSKGLAVKHRWNIGLTMPGYHGIGPYFWSGHPFKAYFESEYAKLEQMSTSAPADSRPKDSEKGITIVDIPSKFLLYKITDDPTGRDLKLWNDLQHLIRFKQEPRDIIHALLLEMDRPHYGVHFRAEKDTIWSSAEHQMGVDLDALDQAWTKYSGSAAATVGKQKPLVYLACGDADQASKFAVQGFLRGWEVRHKWTLLEKNEKVLNELNKLEFDFQGAVDMGIMMRSDFFMGITGSAFSSTIGNARDVTGRYRGSSFTVPDDQNARTHLFNDGDAGAYSCCL